MSLEEREGRSAVRGGTSGGGALIGLARFATPPARPWIPIAIGILMAMPALAALAFDRTFFLETWLVDDRTGGTPRLAFEHHDLSWRGIQVLAVGALGLLLAGFMTAAWLAQRGAPAPRTKKKLRVHAGAGRGETAVTGIARVATVEIESPLGGEPCLVFGMRGDVDGEEVADAEGGDFDVVTPEGDVVMVSLEHAQLEAFGDEKPIELTGEEAVELEPFLSPRVGQRVRERCTLGETLVAAGDTVTVTGRLSGPALAAAPFRGASRGRILEGDADHPVIVRLVKRAERA